MAQKIAMKKYKQAAIGAAALPADMYEPETDSSVQVPMNVENEEPPKTRLERKEEKKMIKEMLKESKPVEATKPKRKKQSVKTTRQKTIKETRAQIVKEFRPAKEPKKEKKLEKEEKIVLDDAYKEIQELVGKKKEEEKVKKSLRKIISRANVITGKKVVENIIDKLPDAYDKKRRKVERKQADKKWEEEKKELKDRIEKYEEGLENKKIKAEERKQKQIEKLALGGSSSSSSSNVFGMRGIEARPLPMPPQKVEKIENKKRSFWKAQNISVIKEQAEIRGHRFDDLETKGQKKVHGVLQSQKIQKGRLLRSIIQIIKNIIIL